MEHIQTLRRRAFEEKAKKKHPIPLGTSVDSLPNEMLSYIFTLGSEEEEEAEYGLAIRRRPRHLPFKVLVSHICRRWRTVVIETSTLWTHLKFAEGPPFHKSRTWLERSKRCMLDIDLYCAIGAANSDESDDLPDASSNDNDDNGNDERVAPEDRDAPSGDLAPAKTKARGFLRRELSSSSLPIVRDLILPHAWRWRFFDLMADDDQDMYDILSTLSSIPEAAQLQVLRLYQYDEDDLEHFWSPHLKQPFAPFCGRAPNLVRLALYGVHVDWAACDFLQGLEELELAFHAKDVRPSYDIFARVLRRSPNLHHLTLRESGPAGDPEDWPTDAIKLRSVRHLVLAFVEPSYASALMKRLVFPNLSKLALDFRAAGGNNYSSFLVQLATSPTTTAAAALKRRRHHHSLCHNLIDLEISGTRCTKSALATFYGALVNLASLNINCHRLPRLFYEYLFPYVRETDELQGCYLPKLETLSTTGIDGKEMRHLLRQRIEVPIKHVLMDSAVDVNVKDEAWIRRKVETFDFFDCSDDEDYEVSEVDEQEMESAE